MVIDFSVCPMSECGAGLIFQDLTGLQPDYPDGYPDADTSGYAGELVVTQGGEEVAAITVTPSASAAKELIYFEDIDVQLGDGVYQFDYTVTDTSDSSADTRTKNVLIDCDFLCSLSQKLLELDCCNGCGDSSRLMRLNEASIYHAAAWAQLNRGDTVAAKNAFDFANRILTYV